MADFWGKKRVVSLIPGNSGKRVTVLREAGIFPQGFHPRDNGVAQGENAVPAPIHLVREAAFRLGKVSVHPATRQVLYQERSETVEPRVMSVLVALHQAGGQVVSRDELIARCWAGRVVGEDAINRAISRVRDLGRGLGDAFQLETIPKVGYRLIISGAAASPPHRTEAGFFDQAGLTPAVSPPGKPLRPSRNRLLMFAGIAALGIAAVTGWLLWPAPRWTVESGRPFISTLALEGEPAFSLDGKMLAYASGSDLLSRKIYVRNVAGGDAIKVTNDDYDDISPTWSPDGTRIAYIAVKAGEPCRIMIANVPGGETREVGRCAFAESTAISWQNGMSFLYYGDQTAPSFSAADPKQSSVPLQLRTDIIVRLDLDSGEKTVLPKQSENTILAFRRLQCSPDGKSLLFIGRESASTDVLRIRDLTSGAERVLGKIVIGGSAAWSEDSREVLTATASGIGSEITAHPIDGAAPYHVYAAPINVSHLAAGAGGHLAMETDLGRQNLARALPAPAAQPDIIDSANGRSWSPTFAPDGTLAFLSNRSGTNAIWVIKPGKEPALLYDGGLSHLFRLEFSPDGSHLAMPVASENDLTIDILTAEGATVSSFHSPTLGGGAPTWTPDSKEVIYFDKSASAYIRVDIANPARRQAAAPLLWGAILYHGGKEYAQSFDQAGYWQIGGTPRLVSGKYPLRWDPPPVLLGDELLVPDFNAPEGPRILAQPLEGGPDRVLAYAPGAEAQQNGLQSKMAVNPKTGEIIYVASVQTDTNIDLLTLAKR
jgi:Tol biopolymer transport system component/DNA-binding winged helix-turn-helix (wHTH) protein